MDKLLPNQKISPNYVKMRIWSEMAGNVVGLIILIILLWCSKHFAWPAWTFWTIIGLIVITVLGMIWSSFEPKLSYNNWRYEIDPEYLQLSYGIFVKKWVTIPITKIQAVTTTQGPLMKRYRLRSIKVNTIGSSHTIPALDEQVALDVRNQISKLAQLKEEEY